MAWAVEFTDIADRQLEKMDKQIRDRILRSFRERVAKASDAAVLAEPLQGEFRGLWRFRIDDYRAICDIRRRSLLVLEVGHRREIYR